MSTPRSLQWSTSVGRDDIPVGDAVLASLHDHPEGTTHGSALFVHGFTGSKEDFAPLLPHVRAAGWRAIAIDLRGQHHSAHDGSPLDAQQLAHDIVASARYVSDLHDGDVHLVGHSFGGLLARRAALAAPDAFASVTLLNSGPRAIDSPEQIDALLRFIGAMEQGMVDAVWDHMRADQLRGQPGLPDDVLTFLEQRLRNGDAASHIAIARSLLTEEDLSSACTALELPFHVVFGDPDDVWPAETQIEMANALRAPYSRLAGLGHSPAVDDPAATSAVIVQWWTQLAAEGQARTTTTTQRDRP